MGNCLSKEYFLLSCFLLVVRKAQSCTINLGDFPSTESEPGIADCDAGCDSCLFSLAAGDTFTYGTIICRESVPCRVEVVMGADSVMARTALHGENASQLTVITTGISVNEYWMPWQLAQIFAPGNGNDFLWQCSVYSCVYATNFKCVNSGLVEFEFYDTGDSGEFYGMNVYAATARNVSITLGVDTVYGINYDSRIYCPKSLSSEGPTCIWKSAAKLSEATHYVYIYTSKGTPQGVELICDNNEERACENVFVKCNSAADECQMTYDGGNWFCDGVCGMFTTTNTPTTTTTQMTTTTRMPTTTTILPTTTMRIPTTTKMPSTTAPATSTGLATSTEETTTAETSTEPPTSTQIATEIPETTDASLAPTTVTKEGGEGKGGGGDLVFIAIGAAVLCVALCVLGVWWLRRKKGAQPKDGDSVVDLGKVLSLSAPMVELPQSAVRVSAQKSEDTEAADLCQDEVVVLEPVVSVPVTVGRDDSAERREVNGAVLKVDKMERDAKDEGFGQQLADLRLANALLEEDVVDDMEVVGDTTSGYQWPVAGEADDNCHESEEKEQCYVTAGADHLQESQSSSFDY